MAIPDANVWTPRVLNTFKEIGLKDPEKDWYFPYDVLLHIAFPWVEDYGIAPQIATNEAKSGAIDEVVFFFVTDTLRAPVFFLQVRNWDTINKPSNRQKADLQMRSRFKDMKTEMKIDRLYGMSACGPEFAIYYLDKHRPDCKVFPLENISGDHDSSFDTCPEAWWVHNLLTSEGQVQFDSLAVEVKQILPKFREQFEPEDN